jgi:ornithine cyclodeaminase/alanine dehydrogenase-like protein (mu-crystallin family)
MTAATTDPIRYLSAADVAACLPGVAGRVDIAAEALRALGRGAAEMPPKIGVHPRPGTLLHAMPAWLREGDLVGLKWVAAFPRNKERGIAAINGLVVLNDADTGLPTWIMDAALITAVRTAAVSGVALRLFAPTARRVALLGAGVQARSHLEGIGALLPHAQVVVADPHPERVTAVIDEANQRAGRQLASAASDARSAVGSAELVITVATMGGATSQLMTPDWLAPGAVVIAVDFATYASAAVAHGARAFVVDDREQFLHYRANGHFDGYPEPTATLGEVLERGAQAEVAANATDDGRPTLISHLGVGLADVLFADAIARAATEQDVGLALPR